MELLFASASITPKAFTTSRPFSSQCRWTCSAQGPSPSTAKIDLDIVEQKQLTRAIRQSLPTARERRWLSEQNICVDRSRGTRYSRQESFSLAVRHLGVESSKSRLTEYGTDHSTRNAGALVPREAEKESATELDSGAMTDARDRICPTDLARRNHRPTSLNQTYQLPQVAESRSSNATIDDRPASAPNSHSSLNGEAAGFHSEPNALFAQGLASESLLTFTSWAYIVRVRVAKFTLGKRAVVRNRAQRRVRAALRSVFPAHASRCQEYVVTVFPAALVTPFPDLVEEAKASLRDTNCWRDTLGEMETRRPRYNKR
jgi:RNase P protein component